MAFLGLGQFVFARALGNKLGDGVLPLSARCPPGVARAQGNFKLAGLLHPIEMAGNTIGQPRLSRTSFISRESKPPPPST